MSPEMKTFKAAVKFFEAARESCPLVNGNPPGRTPEERMRSVWGMAKNSTIVAFDALPYKDKKRVAARDANWGERFNGKC